MPYEDDYEDDPFADPAKRPQQLPNNLGLPGPFSQANRFAQPPAFGQRGRLAPAAASAQQSVFSAAPSNSLSGTAAQPTIFARSPNQGLYNVTAQYNVAHQVTAQPQVAAFPPQPSTQLQMGVITETDKQRFSHLFLQLSNNQADARLPGPEVASYLQQAFPNLSRQVMGQIWECADTDQDGALDHGEFVICMHLCMCHSQNRSPQQQQSPQPQQSASLQQQLAAHQPWGASPYAHTAATGAAGITTTTVPVMELPAYGAPMTPTSAARAQQEQAAAAAASFPQQQASSGSSKSVLDLAYEFGISKEPSKAVSKELSKENPTATAIAIVEVPKLQQVAVAAAPADTPRRLVHNAEVALGALVDSFKQSKTGGAENNQIVALEAAAADQKSAREEQLEHEMHVMESEMLQAMARVKQMEEMQYDQPPVVETTAKGKPSKREKELEERWKDELNDREAAESRIEELEAKVAELESKCEGLEEQLDDYKCGGAVAVSDPFADNPRAGLGLVLSGATGKRRGSMPNVGTPRTTPAKKAAAKGAAFGEAIRGTAPARGRVRSAETGKERQQMSDSIDRVSSVINSLSGASSDVVVMEHNNAALDGKLEKYMLITQVNDQDLRHKRWDVVNAEIRALAQSHRPLTLTFTKPDGQGTVTHTFKDHQPLGIRWADRLKIMNDEVNSMQAQLMGSSRSKSPSKIDRKFRQQLDILNEAVNASAKVRAQQVAQERAQERANDNEEDVIVQ